MDTFGVMSTSSVSSRYNLTDDALAEHALRQMRTEGVCVLPHFLTSHAVGAMVKECDHLAPLAHRSTPRRNPYLTRASHNDASTSATVLYDSLEVLAYDQFPESSPCDGSTNPTTCCNSFDVALDSKCSTGTQIRSARSMSRSCAMVMYWIGTLI